MADREVRPIEGLRPREQSRRGGGAKLSRSETVTVRLDPRLRYLAELAARKQRRTVSSYIEWAIEESLNRVLLKDGYDEDGRPDSVSIADRAWTLWDVDDADRFAKLALSYPEFLTYEEQVLWKLICENGYLWRGGYNKTTDEWVWQPQEGALLMDRLREHWDAFNAVARGESDPSALPKWIKKRPTSESSRNPPPTPPSKSATTGGATDSGDLDDEIPF